MRDRRFDRQPFDYFENLRRLIGSGRFPEDIYSNMHSSARTASKPIESSTDRYYEKALGALEEFSKYKELREVKNEYDELVRLIRKRKEKEIDDNGLHKSVTEYASGWPGSIKAMAKNILDSAPKQPNEWTLK